MSRWARLQILEAFVGKVLAFELRIARRHQDARDAIVVELGSSEVKLFEELGRGSAGLDYLSWRLGRDKGYVSRTLRFLISEGHLTKRIPDRDHREREFVLTESGRSIAREIERQKRQRVRKELEDLPIRQRRRLVSAMATIVEILDRDPMSNLMECVEERLKREAARKIRRA